MIFRHRDLSLFAPESTMVVLRYTVGHQVRWAEADVNVIASRTVIICRDSVLDRTTDRIGRYDDLTTADLAGIDAGDWFSPRFVGEPLPVLSNLIDLMNDSGPDTNIRVKSSEAGKEVTLCLVDDAITQFEHLRLNVKVIVSSFSHLLFLLLKQYIPEAPVGCLCESRALSGDQRNTLGVVDASFIHPEDSGLTRQQVQELWDAGYGVSVWAVSSSGRAGELFS